MSDSLHKQQSTVIQLKIDTDASANLLIDPNIENGNLKPPEHTQVLELKFKIDSDLKDDIDAERVRLVKVLIVYEATGNIEGDDYTDHCEGTRRVLFSTQPIKSSYCIPDGSGNWDCYP